MQRKPLSHIILIIWNSDCIHIRLSAVYKGGLICIFVEQEEKKRAWG